MTLDEARNWVENIKHLKNDDERAHSSEDRFHQAVLEEFAHANLGEWSELAKIALSTRDLDFCRWCA